MYIFQYVQHMTVIVTVITNRLLNGCFVVKSHWFIRRVGLVIVLNYMLIPFACLKTNAILYFREPKHVL